MNLRHSYIRKLHFIAHPNPSNAATVNLNVVLQWWSQAVTVYRQGDYAVQFHSSPTPARSTVTDVPNKFNTSPSTAPTSLPRLIHCAVAVNLFRELSPLPFLRIYPYYTDNEIKQDSQHKSAQYL
jgi:hypothetical protein